MQVINLDSWTGVDFSFMPNEVIDLDDTVALARIAAGLAKAVEPPVKPEEPPVDEALAIKANVTVQPPPLKKTKKDS